MTPLWWQVPFTSACLTPLKSSVWLCPQASVGQLALLVGTQRTLPGRSSAHKIRAIHSPNANCIRIIEKHVESCQPSPPGVQQDGAAYGRMLCLFFFLTEFHPPSPWQVLCLLILENGMYFECLILYMLCATVNMRKNRRGRENWI